LEKCDPWSRLGRAEKAPFREKQNEVNPMALCYYDGSFRSRDEVFLPVTDLSIQRGIGVFDSLRTYGKKPFALMKHLRRFADSAETSGFRGLASCEDMEAIVWEGVRRMDEDVLVRLYCTGGDVNRHGIFPEPRLFVLFESLKPKLFAPSCYSEGVALFSMDCPRPNPLIKSIDYMLPYVAKGGRAEYLEGLYAPGGCISEGTSSSFFLGLGGKLVTAPEGEVLAGVTRRFVLEIAREAGIAVEERAPRMEELASADEAFVSSTLKEIMPVVKVDSRKIGDGRPGALTQHLRRLYLRKVDAFIKE
jgi:branched-chain amino acid aminotransferase